MSEQPASSPSPWHLGALFHNAKRYPRKEGAKRVDRLASILRNGILAPAACTDGSVCSDLNITVTGVGIRYDSLVFLHRFAEVSWLYTMSQPGQFTVFVKPDFPVMTWDQMGEHWVVLSQDEVYVRDRVGPEHLTAVVVNSADAEAVLAEFIDDLRRLGITLYDDEGKVRWAPEAHAPKEPGR